MEQGWAPSQPFGGMKGEDCYLLEDVLIQWICTTSKREILFIKTLNAYLHCSGL